MEDRHSSTFWMKKVALVREGKLPISLLPRASVLTQHPRCTVALSQRGHMEFVMGCRAPSTPARSLIKRRVGLTAPDGQSARAENIFSLHAAVQHPWPIPDKRRVPPHVPMGCHRLSQTVLRGRDLGKESASCLDCGLVSRPETCFRQVVMRIPPSTFLTAVIAVNIDSSPQPVECWSSTSL